MDMAADLSRFAFPIVGTQYWRAPTPTPDEWAGDLKAIAALGFELVQLRVQWSWHERREGELDFAEVVRLMDLAAARGLGVIVKVMLEDAPYWLYENYDAHRVAPSGAIIPPISLGAAYAGLFRPCFDRPLVRDKARPFIRGLVEATRDHPALRLYSLWNEIRSSPYGQCACPDSRRKFEDQLRRRFGTVAELNRFLGKDYGEFSHFRPPAALFDHSSPLLWRSWCRDTLADTLAWVRSIVREAAPDAPVVVHTGMCNVVNNPLGDSTNDWLNAEVVDMYGHSGVFWDGHFMSYQRIAGKAVRSNPDWRCHQYVLSMQDRWTRHVARGRPAMNYEVYGNDYGSLCPDFGPAEMDDFFLTSLSEGVRVLLMWQYRSERLGQEYNGAGLVEMDGATTPRAERVGQLTAFIRANRRLLGDYEPEPARVAIVYDDASDMLSHLQDHAESCDAQADVHCYKSNLKGWYRIFWDANIPADVLSSRADDDWDRYDLVVLPMMMHVSDAMAERLVGRLARSGRVIVDSGFDTRQANGWAMARSPRPGFAALLGRARVGKQMLAETAGPNESPLGPLPRGQYVTAMAGASGPWQSCQTDLLTFFSFNPGEARFLNPTADFTPLYRWLAEWTGLERTSPDMRIRKGSSGGRAVWFVHNLADAPAPLPLAGATDMLSGAESVPPDGWVVLVK